MRTVLFLLFLLGNASQAQVGLTISDETNRGFFIGINGFLQSKTSSKNLYISNLDTVPTVLMVWQDSTLYFEKTIHFREKGDYKYVLTVNSREKLQLRYRGEGGPPAAAEKLKLEMALPIKNELVFAQKPKTIQDSDSQDSSKKSIEIIPQEDTTVFTVKDSSVSDTIIVADKSIPVVPLFDRTLQKMNQSTLEFERLNFSLELAENHQFSTEEIVKVLKLLNYDNTRLQFLQKILSQKEKWDNSKLLFEGLDFEASRETLKKLLNEN